MLQRICSGISKSFAIDPVNVIERKMKFPSYPLSRYSHVVVPVYMKTLEHWMVQIVELPAMSQSETQLRNVTLVLYDPLGPGHNSRFFEDTWSSYTLPLLKEWSRRDCALIQAKSGSKSTQLGRGDTIREIEQPKEITLTEVDDPVAYSYITGSRTFEKNKKISANDMEIMRLCIMREILCKADSVEDASADIDNWRKVQKVNKFIHEYFTASEMSEAIL
ncbi:hypothetical protein F441_17610 [Phytophthora nicotianae CJ01A1]|uniref:Ubiquitin-like protease family profile domain-containing protein n=1 Tax=Phytophthora nicotianae CJ01A1 TaxID=1317063 RepID=W2W5Z8_PHYNI|nr:hypothetical protein F441_17610 [Phytophthora nicotianae CJ01A1]